jgi:aspartyl protease family protein
MARGVVGADKGSGKAESRARLLVDTGASYTMLPVEILVTLGYDISKRVGSVRLHTANGIVIAPLVTVSWFNCLGHNFKDFTVAAHTIRSAPFDGVLGMDFLIRCRAIISTADGEISFK